MTAAPSVRRFASTLLLGVLIGLTSAWIFDSLQDSEISSNSITQKQSETHPRPGEQSPASTKALPGNPIESTRTAPATTADSNSAASGSCRIFGRVTNDQGEALPGAEIFVHATRSALPSDFLDWPIETQLEELRIRQSSRRQAYTNSTGTFEISGLTAQNYDVYGKLDNKVLQLQGTSNQKARINSRELSNAKGEVQINFTARPVTGVTLRLFGPNDEELTQAAIRFKGLHDWSIWHEASQAWSASNPVINLSRGVHNFVVTSGDRDQLRSDLISLDLTSSSPTRALEIHLKEALGLEVTIRSSAKIHFDSSSAIVLAYPFSGEVPSNKTITESYQQSLELDESPGKAGHFYTRTIDPGQYLVALAAGQSILASTTVEISQGVTRVELSVNLDEQKPLRLIALDPNGGPISNLQTEMIRGTEARDYVPCKALRAGDEWLIFVDPLKEAANPSDAAMTLTAVTRFGRRSITFQPGELGPWTLQFDSPARLDVQITGFRGSGLENGLKVYILDYKTSSGRAAEERLDAEGKASFGSLSPGEIEVALVFDRDWGTLVLNEQRISLEPGSNTLSIPAPRASPLRVKCSPETSIGIENAPRSRCVPSNIQAQESDEQGLVNFGPVPHGRWRLHLPYRSASIGTPAKMIDHRGPTEVTFEYSKYSALEISAPLISNPAIDLQVGDRVVAVNSKSFRCDEDLDAISESLTNEAQIQLTIERAGARRNLSISKDQWSKLSDRVFTVGD